MKLTNDSSLEEFYKWVKKRKAEENNMSAEEVRNSFPHKDGPPIRRKYFKEYYLKNKRKMREEM